MRFFNPLPKITKELHLIPKPIKQMTLLTFIYYLSWGTVEPFLPIYLKSVLKTYTNVGFIISLIYFLSIIWSVPMGNLVDKISKKKVATFILALYIPMGPIILLLRTVFQFVIFKIYHSFLAAAFWTNAESYVRYYAPEEKKSESIGIHDFGSGLALVIGAILGGVLASFFQIEPLFLIIPVFVSIAFLYSFKLKDGKTTSQFQDGFRKTFTKDLFSHSFKDFFKEKRLIILSMISFFYYMAIFSLHILFPLFSESLGANFLQIGIIFALLSLPLLCGPFFGNLADKHGRARIMFISAILSSLVFLFTFFIKDIKFLFISSIFLAISLNLFFPALEGRVAQCMPRAKIGEFNGVYRSIKLTGGGLGIFLVGPIADKFGINAPFLMGFAIMLVLAIIIRFRVLKIDHTLEKKL